MAQTFPELPGWEFETNEITPGVYRVSGRDRAGRTVDRTGLDPDALIEESRGIAVGMMVDVESAGEG